MAGAAVNQPARYDKGVLMKPIGFISEPEDDSGWGMPVERSNPNDGSARWGARVEHATIEFESVETLPYGMRAKVENVGTPTHPRLKLYLPAGPRGLDAPMPDGTTSLEYQKTGLKIKNGIVVLHDQSRVGIRSVVCDSDVGFKGELNEDGVVMITANLKQYLDTLFKQLLETIEPRFEQLENSDNIEVIQKQFMQQNMENVKANANRLEMWDTMQRLMMEFNTMKLLVGQLHPEVLKFSPIAPIPMASSKEIGEQLDLQLDRIKLSKPKKPKEIVTPVFSNQNKLVQSSCTELGNINTLPSSVHELCTSSPPVQMPSVQLELFPLEAE